MFDKNKFAQIIKNIKETYDSQEDFAMQSGIGRTYLSQYMNMKLEEPPKPRILEKLANSSKGIVSYKELMNICGYSEKTLEAKVYTIYNKLKDLSKKIYKEDNQDLYEVGSAIEHFQEYSSDLIETLEKKNLSKIYLTDYYRKNFFLEEYNLICAFLFLYDSFLQCLMEENYIILDNYKYTNWFDMDDLYEKINDLDNWELLSYNATCINVNLENLNSLLNYIKFFSKALNLAYLSDFDSSALTKLFKKKAQNSNSDNEISAGEWTNKEKYNETINSDSSISYSEKLYLLPILCKITARQPILADENVEGYLPTDPNIYHLTDPDNYFYLKVNDNSMNKIIAKNTYVLFEMQETANTEDIVLVCIDNKEPIIRKCMKIENNMAIFQTLSDEKSELEVILNNERSYKILGKMIAQINIV